MNHEFVELLEFLLNPKVLQNKSEKFNLSQSLYVLDEENEAQRGVSSGAALKSDPGEPNPWHSVFSIAVV